MCIFFVLMNSLMAKFCANCGVLINLYILCKLWFSFDLRGRGTMSSFPLMFSFFFFFLLFFSDFSDFNSELKKKKKPTKRRRFSDSDGSSNNTVMKP